MTRKRKPRLILAVKTLNRISYLRQCLATWSSTANIVDFLWKIVVADDGSQDGTLQYLETFGPAPITLIRNQRRYAVGQFNSILAVALIPPVRIRISHQAACSAARSFLSR